MMPAPFPASQLHTNTDIRNVMRALMATQQAALRLSAGSRDTELYAQGFREGLQLLAEALHIDLGIPAAWHYREG